jgi:opacity protein-like surface antigen
MKTLLLLAALLVGLSTAVLAADEHPAIIAATRSYVAANSGMTKITVTVEQVDGDFARVKVAPEDSKAADPAWVFLQKKDGKWTGLTLGTSFTTEDYQQLGIPNALRIP